MSQPTIRKQRIRRSSVKTRLIVFGTVVDALIEVYNSFITSKIDDYNSRKVSGYDR